MVNVGAPGAAHPQFLLIAERHVAVDGKAALIEAEIQLAATSHLPEGILKGLRHCVVLSKVRIAIIASDL